MTLPAPDITTDQMLRGTNLSCRRGGRLVFEGLDFSVGRGELVQLVGRNGSGKSTLLRMVAGLVRPSEGVISYLGAPWGAGDVAASESVIYVGHDHGLKPALTLAENCRNYVRLMTGETATLAALLDAAAAFGLERLLHQPVRFFSSGQRHRSSLLRFCLIDRPVWLMDEPTVGLDSENREALAAIMRDHLRDGGMILAATHDPLGIMGRRESLEEFQPKARLAEDFWA